MTTPETRNQLTHAAINTDLVRTYLREIDRVPLLSAEQELMYSRQVQQMMVLTQAKTALAQTLEREPTVKEWAHKVNLAESDLSSILVMGQQAKQRMIEANCAWRCPLLRSTRSATWSF